MCAIDYAEPFEEYEVADVAAAELQTCSECEREIKVGETYEHLRALDSGEWMDFRTCIHCDSAGKWLDIVCGGWPHCCLGSELEEHRDEYPTSAVLEYLFASFQAKWHDGADPIPDGVEISVNARRCLEMLVA
jgi:hypothetical protein